MKKLRWLVAAGVAALGIGIWSLPEGKAEAAAPVIRFVDAHGTPYIGNPPYLEPGDVLDLKLTFDEPVACPVDDYSQTITAEAGDNGTITLVWDEAKSDFGAHTAEQHFTYTVKAGDPNGPLEFVASNVYCQPEGGVGGYHLSVGTLQSLTQRFTIDTWALSVVSDAVSGSVFKPGEKVRFQLQFDLASSLIVSGNLSARMNTGGSAAFVRKVGVRNLEFEYIVRKGDDTAALDIAEVVDGSVTDGAGHPVDFTFYEGRNLSDAALLRADGVPPTVSVSPSSVAQYDDTHTLSVTASDRPDPGLDIPLYYVWNTSTTAPPADQITGTGMYSGQPVPVPPGLTGQYYLHIRAEDEEDVDLMALSNTGVYRFGPYAFDNEAPTVTLSPSTGTDNAPISIRIAASDVRSGMDGIRYRWGSDGEWSASTPGGVLTVETPPAEGSYVLYVAAADRAGSIRTTNSGTYRIDKTAPQASFSESGGETPAKSKTVTVMLAGASGETADAWTFWSASVTPPNAADAGWQPLLTSAALPAQKAVASPPDANGTWYLHVKTADPTGNTQIFTTADGFPLDSEPPSLAFLPNGSQGAYKKSEEVRLRIDGLSTGAEGYAIRYMISGSASPIGDPASWPVSTDGAFELANVSGTRYIHVRVADAAGNEATLSSDPFYLDHLPPDGEVRFSRSHTNVPEVQLDAIAADNTASELELSYAVDGGGWSEWLSYAADRDRIVALPALPGPHTVAVKYRDEAGNESAAVTGTAVYDIVPPQVDEVAYSPSGWTNGTVAATVTFTDDYSPDGTVVSEFVLNGTYPVTFADQAGNVSSVDVTIDNIEKEKPTAHLTSNGSSSSIRTASTSISATDNISSPEKIALSYAWSQNGLTAPSGWTPATDGESVELTDVDGLWYLWVRATDEAGNVSATPSEPYRMDNTPPQGTVTYSPASRTALPVTAIVTLSEPATVTRPSSGEREHTFTENGTYAFEFVDEAGNAGSATATVDWIDASLPSATITNEPQGWTNEPVDVTISVAGEPPRALRGIQAPAGAQLIRLRTLEHGDTSLPVEGATVTEAVYRLVDNGTIYFTIEDLETGLTSDTETSVTRIDKVAPTGALVYSHLGWTREDVTVRLTASDDRTGVVVDGPSSYAFTENGTYTFTYSDEAGNRSESTAVVTWIDKEAPNPVIAYSTREWTSGSVVAALSFDNEAAPVVIANNGGESTHTFEENGTFTFFYEDAAGNAGSVAAKVDWIDRIAPTGRIIYSKSGWTNEDVIATLLVEDNSGAEITVLSEGGNEHRFTENGQFAFRFRDRAGNIGTAAARAERIDKTPPAANVAYSATAPTNAAVRASVRANEPVTVRNNGGSTTYDFAANGMFTFELIDRAGNLGVASAQATNIDRTPPTLTVSYSSTDRTNGNVIAKVNADEPIRVLNNVGRSEYVFKENGRFTFVVQDVAGNIAEREAVVANIDKSRANVSLVYSETNPTRNPVTASVQSDRPLTILNNGGSAVRVFDRNGSFWLQAQDELGNRYDLEMKVTNIDNVAPEITYLSGERLIVPVGSAVDPLGDIRAFDNADGDLLPSVTVTHAIDPTVPGEYEAVYRVKDRAGNETVAVRDVWVVDPEELSVFVNGMSSAEGEALVQGREVFLRWYGAQGSSSAEWAYGKLDKGAFKTGGQPLTHDKLEADRQGYYTFLVQDQERNYRLLHVYVIPR